MTIDKIHYEQLFPTGVYANERYRVEISLNESDFLESVSLGELNGVRSLDTNEVINNAFETAKKLVNAAFEKLNPQIKWNEPPILGSHIPEVDPKKKDLEEKIMDCTSKEDLLLLQSDSLKYGLEIQYISKLKSFQ